jgi:hypothetical protein
MQETDMNPADALSTLACFSGLDLTGALSAMERTLVGATMDNCDRLLLQFGAQHDVLAAAGLVKQLAGQINVVIHALGIMLCLPHLLQPGEVIESISLGAGNTGKSFDLETNQRVAEFKFITWRGGPEVIRQNSVFKDFYGLAECRTAKSRHLYVLGTEIPVTFLSGNRAIDSVLSKDVTLYNDFRRKYPEYKVVRDYYLPRREAVRIEDVSSLVSELVHAGQD